jgi:hypothetical protein
VRTVFKYPLLVTDIQTISTHEGAKALTVGRDPQGTFCLWAEVDTKKTLVEAKVFIVGTGREVPANATRYVGSVVTAHFVWHIYVGKNL